MLDHVRGDHGVVGIVGNCGQSQIVDVVLASNGQTTRGERAGLRIERVPPAGRSELVIVDASGQWVDGDHSSGRERCGWAADFEDLPALKWSREGRRQWSVVSFDPPTQR